MLSDIHLIWLLRSLVADLSCTDTSSLDPFHNFTFSRIHSYVSWFLNAKRAFFDILISYSTKPYQKKKSFEKNFKLNSTGAVVLFDELFVKMNNKMNHCVLSLKIELFKNELEFRTHMNDVVNWKNHDNCVVRTIQNYWKKVLIIIENCENYLTWKTIYYWMQRILWCEKKLKCLFDNDTNLINWRIYPNFIMHHIIHITHSTKCSEYHI